MSWNLGVWSPRTHFVIPKTPTILLSWVFFKGSKEAPSNGWWVSRTPNRESWACLTDRWFDMTTELTSHLMAFLFHLFILFTGEDVIAKLQRKAERKKDEREKLETKLESAKKTIRLLETEMEAIRNDHRDQLYRAMMAQWVEQQAIQS